MDARRPTIATVPAGRPAAPVIQSPVPESLIAHERSAPVVGLGCGPLRKPTIRRFFEWLQAKDASSCRMMSPHCASTPTSEWLPGLRMPGVFEVPNTNWFTSDTTVTESLGGCMLTRPSFVSLALLVVQVPAPNAQTDKPEILWQFEAGG